MANESITAAQISGITSLDEAYEIAGIEGSIVVDADLRAMVDTFLGSPQNFDDVGMIPDSALSASIARRAGTSTPFTLRVVARIYKFQEICNLKSKTTPGTVRSLSLRPPPGTAGPLPPDIVTPPPGRALVAENVSGSKKKMVTPPLGTWVFRGFAKPL